MVYGWCTAIVRLVGIRTEGREGRGKKAEELMIGHGGRELGENAGEAWSGTAFRVASGGEFGKITAKLALDQGNGGAYIARSF